MSLPSKVDKITDIGAFVGNGKVSDCFQLCLQRICRPGQISATSILSSLGARRSTPALREVVVLETTVRRTSQVVLRQKEKLILDARRADTRFRAPPRVELVTPVGLVASSVTCLVALDRFQCFMGPQTCRTRFAAWASHSGSPVFGTPSGILTTQIHVDGVSWIVPMPRWYVHWIFVVTLLRSGGGPVKQCC